MRLSRPSLAVAAVVALAPAACVQNEIPEADLEQQALLDVKGYVAAELDALHEAAVAIQERAPAPDADGWNHADDAAAIEEMRASWRDARRAYEHVEGAIAVLFADLDASTDERYDGFIAAGADDDLFDGDGVTGVHAIERILWSNEIPAHVVEFESGLPGYVEARTPVTAEEARKFKEELCQRLVDDTAAMVDGFRPLALDNATAYRGVIGSILEQHEKVSFAGSGEDESRYAQATLLDMRANLDGGEEIFGFFEPLLESKGDEGTSVKNDVRARFGALRASYDDIDGDAIPEVPATWNPDAPSEADSNSPYGKLFLFIAAETDVEVPTSLVSRMLAGADLLEIPLLPE